MIGLLTAALAATLVVGESAPTLQGTLDLAQDGDVVEVPGGTWPGPARVERAVTLRGSGVVDGGGAGRVITLAAPGAVLEGLTVRASGRDLQTTDACVYVETVAVGAAVRGTTMRDCLWGVWVNAAPEVRVEDNDVGGVIGGHPSNKGNGVHLFDVSRGVVRGNVVHDARDGIYISATEDTLIADNVAEDVRYGIHYMYSHRNEVRNNRTRRCSGGIALMQSSHLTVTGNVSTDNKRQGILFRDTQHSVIRGNVVERNGEGMFFFSSLDNEISGNRFAGNDIGARVWAGTERNRVFGNDFVGNRQQVYFVSASDQTWGTDEDGGNHWSDYLGWDQDGDGLGDRPYRVDSFLSGLLYRFPSAVLLLCSPTLELLGLAERQLPVLRSPTIHDPRPRIGLAAEIP